MSQSQRIELTKKINSLMNDEILFLTEDEIKYMIIRWIQGNWNDIVVNDIKIQHYTEPDDPAEKEKVGTNVSLVKIS